MSNLPAFGAYAAAFEDSLKDDDWTRLERFFSPDATYLPGDGTEAIGREAVLQALRESVDALEKKCDGRALLTEPQIGESGDTVTMQFTARYTKHGLILAMEDVFDDPSALFDWRANL